MANSYTQVSHAVQVRAEDPKAPIPGYNSCQQDTLMAKALYIRSFKAFALTGVLDNFKRTGRYFSRLSANSWN